MEVFKKFSSIELTLPPLEIFKIPSKPLVRMPLMPRNTPTGRLFHPFEVNPRFFNLTMGSDFVFTFVAAYVSVVFLLNRFNDARQYRPWSLTRTTAFKVFMITHNTMLALFSAWAISGMIYNQVVHWYSATSGLERGDPTLVVEYLCNMDSKDYRILTKPFLGSEERIIYMYWIFYVSKFYEVVDTLIILARGKRSSNLQTFHHAGVIIIGWTGLRYESPMAPPGAILNAAVHTLMYFYFTLQTLGISVSKRFKRALTSIQIAQFIVGLGFAHFYLFVNYKAPLPAPGTDSLQGSVQSPNGSDGIATFPCLNNQGGAFPLVVASSYLLPLIYLFVEFYINSYGGKTAAPTTTSTRTTAPKNE